jgi:lactoylglutathione lyase
MFKLLAYEHVGIRVSDRARSVAFYETLGFRMIEDLPEHQALEMASDNGVIINLIYNAQARARNILLDEPVKHPGVTHPAFVVDSLDAVVNRLNALGIRITEGPEMIGDRRRVCFIRDPDGTVLEFDEVLR